MRMKITQTDFMIEYLKQQMKEAGIDIDDNNYYLDPKFQELRKYPIYGAEISEAWFIEKNIVGKNRLRRIYGKYMPGVMETLTADELKNEALYEEIRKYYKNATANDNDAPILLNENLQRYFYRKEKGLLARLRHVGFDISDISFAEQIDGKYKLMYCLYFFELQQADVSLLLSKPDFENINDILGKTNRNGMYLAYLKDIASRELSRDGIREVKNLMVNVPQLWEECIKDVIGRLDVAKGDTTELLRIRYELTNLVKESCINYPEERYGEYEPNIWKSLYLFLSEHEMISLEKGLLSVGYSDVMKRLSEEDLRRYASFDKEVIPMDKSAEYISTNRKEFTRVLFKKAVCNSNDYKRIDNIIPKYESLIGFLQDNTKVAFMKEKFVTKLFIIAALDEILQTDKGEKVGNDFYRYNSADNKSLSSELNAYAFRKSQVMWISKVMRRYNVYRDRFEESCLIRDIEHLLDQLLLTLYYGKDVNSIGMRSSLLIERVNRILYPDESVSQIKTFFTEKIMNDTGMRFLISDEDARRLFYVLPQIDEDGSALELLIERIEAACVTKSDLCKIPFSINHPILDVTQFEENYNMVINNIGKTVSIHFQQSNYSSELQRGMENCGIKLK